MNLRFGKKEFLEQPKQNVIDVHSHECLDNNIVFLNNLKHNYLQSLFFCAKKSPAKCASKSACIATKIYMDYLYKNSHSPVHVFFGQTNERGTLAITLDV